MLMKQNRPLVGLLLACTILEVDSGHCIYVGDSIFDFRAAFAAGMQSIGV